MNCLKAAGSSADRVVKCTIYCSNSSYFAAINKVYAEYFGAAPPARSTLVSDLVVDGKVEIELVAYKPRD